MNNKIDIVIQYLFILLGVVIPVSPGVTNIIIGLIIVLWFFHGRLIEKINIIFSHRWVVFIFLLLVFYILGLLWGDNHDNSIWIFQRLALILVFPVFLTLNLHQKTLKNGVKAFLATLFIISLIAICINLNIINHLSEYISFVNERNVVFSTYNYHNIFLALGFLILMSVIFENKSKNIFIPIFFALIYFISVFSESGRAGQLLIIVFSIVYIFYYNKKKIYKLLLYLAAFFLTQFLIYNYSDVYNERVDTTIYRIQNNGVKEIGQERKDPRYVFTKWTVKKIIEKPILGYGSGSFKKIFDKELNVNGYYNRDMTPHNNYLFVMFEIGLIGVFLLIMIFYYQIKYLGRNSVKIHKMLLPLTFIFLMFIDSYFFIYSIMMIYIYLYIIYLKYQEC